jgi:hypothetical protein
MMLISKKPGLRIYWQYALCTDQSCPVLPYCGSDNHQIFNVCMYGNATMSSISAMRFPPKTVMCVQSAIRMVGYVVMIA